MKLLLIILALGACANNEPSFAEETATPCHKLVKRVDLGGGKTRLIFNCDTSDYMDIEPAKDGKDGLQGPVGPKGNSGSGGIQGPIGPRGLPGTGGAESFSTLCIHGEDHIDKTWSITPSEFMTKHFGVDNAYAGACHDEGQCTCDECPRFSDSEPRFYHQEAID